jgi:hypothetical protein
MNARYLGVIAFVGGLVLPVVTCAQSATLNSNSSSDGTAVVDKLQRQERMDEFKAKFWTQEPITQQNYYVQERQDRQLIARISAGEKVSHDELEQALKRVDTEY